MAGGVGNQEHERTSLQWRTMILLLPWKESLLQIVARTRRHPSTQALAPVKKVVPGAMHCSSCRWCHTSRCSSAACEAGRAEHETRMKRTDRRRMRQTGETLLKHVARVPDVVGLSSAIASQHWPVAIQLLKAWTGKECRANGWWMLFCYCICVCKQAQRYQVDWSSACKAKVCKNTLIG